MRISVREQGDVIIMTLSGRLDSAHAEQFKTEFRRQLGRGKWFIFDLARMEYLDSSGLGALVFCLKNCNALSGALKLVQINEKSKLIFNITRARGLFQMYDSIEAALDSFQE